MHSGLTVPCVCVCVCVLTSCQIAEQLMTIAYESGVNLFDTAEVYAGGRLVSYEPLCSAELITSIHVSVWSGADIWPHSFSEVMNNWQVWTDNSNLRKKVSSLDYYFFTTVSLKPFQTYIWDWMGEIYFLLKETSAVNVMLEFSLLWLFAWSNLSLRLWILLKDKEKGKIWIFLVYI